MIRNFENELMINKIKDLSAFKSCSMSQVYSSVGVSGITIRNKENSKLARKKIISFINKKIEELSDTEKKLKEIYEITSL